MPISVNYPCAAHRRNAQPPFPGAAALTGEMALVPSAHRAGAESAGEAFGVKRVVFSVGAMSGTARRRLRKRLMSELDAVRDVIRKAESFRPDGGGGPSGEAGGAGLGEDGRLTPAEPHPDSAMMEVDGGSGDAKRRRVSSLVVRRSEEQKGAALDGERARLAGRLTTLAAALPEHVVAFLQNHRTEDGDFHRGDGGEAETDIILSVMKDGALLQLKLLLDKFAPAESTPEKNHGRAAAPDAASGGVSCVSQLPHQDAASDKGPVEEKKGDASGIRDDKTGPAEKEGDAGGGTGASGRIHLRDIAEEYGELVEAVGVLLLSPLPRSLIELAERGGAGDDEYVDICGNASPVVLPCITCKVDEICSSPSSGSRSGASSSSDEDWDDTSSCSSDSSDSTGSGSDESAGGPPPGFDKVGDNYTFPPRPASNTVWIAEAEEDQCRLWPPTPTARPITISPPAPLVLLPKESDSTAQISEAMQVAKAEAVRNQCTVPPNIGSSPPALLSLPKVNDTSAQPPAPARSVESEEVQNQGAAVIAPTEPLINISPPAPAAEVPNGNNASDQPPPPVAAPDAAHIVIAAPEEEQHHNPNAAPAAPVADEPALTDLIARAQEAAERRRREEINRERHRARQELIDMERAAAAVPDHRVRPQDMELLGIAAFEHVVSTVERTGRPRSGCPTVMQFLGLFLRADDDEEREQTPAGGGTDMDVEEGEIR